MIPALIPVTGTSVLRGKYRIPPEPNISFHGVTMEGFGVLNKPCKA